MVVCFALVTACAGPNDGSRLVFPGEGTGVASLPRISAGSPYTFGGSGVCTTKKPITITSVTLFRPRGGLRIVDWATRPWNTGPADSGPLGAKVLARSIPGFTRRPISAVCSRHDAVEFAFTVEKPDATTANADGALIHYRVGGANHVVDVRLAIQLCGAADRSKLCQ